MYSFITIVLLSYIIPIKLNELDEIMLPVKLCIQYMLTSIILIKII